MSSRTIDVEQWVRRWADEDSYSSVGINWSGVTVKPSEAQYTWYEYPGARQNADGTDTAEIVHSEIVAEYENMTDLEQTYTVSAKRTMHNEWTLELKTGFSRGVDFDVTLEIPQDVTQYGFPSVVPLRTSRAAMHDQAMTLNLDTPVKVSPKHKATVSVVTTDLVYQGEFTQDLRVRGKVSVNRYMDSTFYDGANTNMRELALRDENRVTGVTIGGSGTDYFDVHVNGSCLFKVLASQKIRVDEVPLAPSRHRRGQTPH